VVSIFLRLFIIAALAPPAPPVPAPLALPEIPAKLPSSPCKAYIPMPSAPAA